MLDLVGFSVPSRLFIEEGHISSGKLIHLVGPNGSGKSTLLAAMAGMLDGQGSITLDGQPLSHYSSRALARKRAYLAQQQQVTVYMPVFQYLLLHMPENSSEKKADILITYLTVKLGLQDKLTRDLHQLSGGEWQRVRLAAVFLQVWPGINTDARLLLLDEPMNALDVGQQQKTDELIAELCAAGSSVVCSAHNLNHTLEQADGVWLLSEGNVLAQGTPADVMTADCLSSLFGIRFELYAVNGRQILMTEKKE